MPIHSAVRRLFPEERTRPASSPVPSGGGRTEYDLRVDGENLLRAAVAAVEPRGLVARAMESHARGVPAGGRVFVAGFGTAAVPMARGLYDVLGQRVQEATLIVPAGGEGYVAPGCDIFRGANPLPDAGCVAGAQAIRQMAREAGPDDLLICLVSGGGSALLTLPPDDLPLEDVRVVTERLLRAGAEWTELDCVLKRLDVLKGGQLAREAAPARVLGLVLSDAVDGGADSVAAGPLSPDPTRFVDAVTVLKRYGLWSDVPLAARGWLDRGQCGEVGETPRPGDPLFLRTSTVVVGNAELAARAACAEAELRGYDAQVLTTTLCGSAREAGVFLAETARVVRAARKSGQPPTCLIATGRTVVRRRESDGRTGRNHELALGAAIRIDGMEGALVASMSTCGLDDAGEAAGATATGSTVRRAAERGIDCAEALERGTAHAVFDALDDRIVSGPTGSPVGDIQIVLLA
jgi:hydroxypyruvate reductase